MSLKVFIIIVCTIINSAILFFILSYRIIDYKNLFSLSSDVSSSFGVIIGFFSIYLIFLTFREQKRSLDEQRNSNIFLKSNNYLNLILGNLINIENKLDGTSFQNSLGYNSAVSFKSEYWSTVESPNYAPLSSRKRELWEGSFTEESIYIVTLLSMLRNVSYNYDSILNFSLEENHHKIAVERIAELLNKFLSIYGSIFLEFDSLEDFVYDEDACKSKDFFFISKVNYLIDCRSEYQTFLNKFIEVGVIAKESNIGKIKDLSSSKINGSLTILVGRSPLSILYRQC